MRFRSASNPHGLIRYHSDHGVCVVALNHECCDHSIVANNPLAEMAQISADHWCVFWIDPGQHFYYRGKGEMIVIIELGHVVKVLKTTCSANGNYLAILPNWIRIIVILGDCDCDPCDGCLIQETRQEYFCDIDCSRDPREIMNDYPECLSDGQIAICIIDQFHE